MLGLAALGLTFLMIYTLVKNALIGKQLAKEDGPASATDLIIPMTTGSTFFAEGWKNSLSDQLSQISQVKIHVLIDGHHPALRDWEDLQARFTNIELHNFPMRPSEVRPVPWMIDQISPKISSPIVILGDPEVIPTAQAFISVGKLVRTKERSFFVLPQTARTTFLGEVISALNPTLAFTSFFGHKLWRRKMTNSLIDQSEGWMAMSVEAFRRIDFKNTHLANWKNLIIQHWQKSDSAYSLAFGEKFLKRYYPESLSEHLKKMNTVWDQLWLRPDRTGFGLYLTTLFLWSFPFLCFKTHLFWSMASFCLLLVYRFFSKVVFQESWMAFFLHPLACLAWMVSFVLWLVEKFQGRSLKKISNT